MALIKCPECSTDVSSMAAACPKCAYPISAAVPSAPALQAPASGSVLAAASSEETVFVIQPSFRPAKILYISALVFFVLSVVFNDQTTGFFGLFASVSVVCAIVYHVKRSYRLYTLTTEKLSRVSGIFSRREDVIPVTRIQNATSASGFVQLLWGVGDILVESAGDRVGLIYLWSVDDPQGRTRQILEAARKKTAHQSA